MSEKQERVEDHFIIVDAGELEYEKLPIEDILEDAKKIDASLIADEVVVWLEANVENFIDNHSRIFNLDLILDAEDQMVETRKLQDLYRAIPDDEHLIDMSEIVTLESIEANLSDADKESID